MQNDHNMTASWGGGRRNWQGVVKVDGKKVWTCKHRHRNREHYTVRGGQAALACARNEIQRRLREQAG